MCNTPAKLSLALVLLCLSKTGASPMDRETYLGLLPFRECLNQNNPGLCLKEAALDALNTTMRSDQPFVLFDTVEIAKNPNYSYNLSLDSLPDEASARSTKLSDILYAQIEDFFKSRVVKLNMAPAFDEARRRRNRRGGMMMLAMGGVAYMMAQLFMGKIAFMAGTALVVAKLALFLSAIIGLKKLTGGGGGGGGETSHVVYASSDGHSHGGGGGGGWHRSLGNDAQSLAYKAHITEASAGY